MSEKSLDEIVIPGAVPKPRRTRRQRLRLIPTGPLARFFHLLFGRPLANSESEAQKVGPFQGVPILGLDAFGSASYGPEAALAILIPLGALGLARVQEVIGAIVCLLAILYFSYRQTIAAYPDGGGSFTVAKENLGERAGMIAAAALLLDYILNVAVGISAGVGALVSAVPALHSYTLWLCVSVLVLITFVNLRGVRESGLAWSVPTYAFVGTLATVLVLGIWKALSSGGHPAPVVAPAPLHAAAGSISAWLVLRAFASGCTAMTGVEAVSNAVPIFAEPRVKNARRTLTLLCLILGVLLLGIGYLTRAYNVAAMVQEEADYQSVVSQLTAAVSGRGVLYFLTMGSVLAVLTLSANTSFAGFPRLCCMLAEDGFLPRGFANLGRRLVYSTGIVVLFVCSAALLIAFGGITDRLIPLFAVGAFGAFTMSQAGMVVHWRRVGGKRVRLSMIINGFGALTTAVALIIIIVAKFSQGAWITVVLIPGFVLLFSAIKRHYRYVAREIQTSPALQVWKVRPLSVVIPVDGWKPDQRARRSARHPHLRRHYGGARHGGGRLQRLFQNLVRARRGARACCRRSGARLEIIHSPYRQLFQPLLAFVEQMKEEKPDHLIGVVIPELVQPRWWEYLLHNNVATSLKALLLLHGGDRVVGINAPWYLREAESLGA